MKEPILESTIDQYLLGTISPEDRSFLESQMATDPSVAAMVEESKLAYKAILLERNRLLKEKLRQLDKEDLREQHIIPKKLGLVLIMLGIVVLICSFLTAYFGPVKIAQRNFVAHVEIDILTTVPADAGWEAAERAFIDHDFEKAIQAYTDLALTADADLRYLARWNSLMAQLAAGGTPPGWQLAMDAFIKGAPESWAKRGKAVRDMLDSRLYRLWFSPLDQKFSTLKPRLI